MISLLTNGWICYAKRTIIRRFVLPMNLEVSMPLNNIDLQIANKPQVSIKSENIENLNLKLTDKNITIKKSNIINIGVNRCSQE